MKILSSIFLVCFLIFSISAQQGAGAASAAVTGQLTVNGRVISNTRIKLVSQTQEFEATTDSNGNYRFENVADGSYLLAFGENRMQVKVANGTVSISNVGEVSVIAAGTTQSLDEVSKTVNIINAQELRERADFSLVESLRTIPGFRVQQLGGFGRTASIKTRGLRNQDTAILIDGIRFRDASSITGDASAFLSDFTLTSVSRLEILRGSGSSLYGTNAIGGTLDFQTPKPAAALHGQISGVGGGYGLGRFRGNISDGTKDGKFGFNLGVSRTVYTKGIDEEDDARNTNFQSRVEYNPFSKTNISGRLFVTDAYVRLNSSPDTIGTLPLSNATIIDAIPLSRAELRRYETGTTRNQLNSGNATFIPDANDPDNFQKSRALVGQIVLTQILSDKLFFRGSYQALRTERRNDNGLLGVGFQSASKSVFDGLIQTANGQFNWTPNRANEITLAYEFEHEKYGNEGFTPTGAGNFFTRARQSSNTVYAQDLLKLFDNKLQLAAGARAQFFDLKTPTFSASNAPYANVTLENPPNAYTFDGAASYFFEQTGTKIRAHVGNGYRVPSLYERFGTFFSSFSQSFFAFGDPDLKPEKTIAFDGGLEQNLSAGRGKLSAVYFYTKLIDTIGFANAVPPIGNTSRVFGGYLNTKGGIARGGEFSGQIKAGSSTDLFASYTYTNSDQRVPQVTSSRIVETLSIPKHQFTLVATQRFGRAWVNFDFLATSDYLAPVFSNTTFATYVYRFGGNRKADLTAGYTFPLKAEKLSLRVYGTIENLFDFDYYENGFRTFGRTARAGASFSF